MSDGHEYNTDKTWRALGEGWRVFSDVVAACAAGVVWVLVALFFLAWGPFGWLAGLLLLILRGVHRAERACALGRRGPGPSYGPEPSYRPVEEPGPGPVAPARPRPAAGAGGSALMRVVITRGRDGRGQKLYLVTPVYRLPCGGVASVKDAKGWRTLEEAKQEARRLGAAVPERGAA
jgi:hypothetical protein